MVKRIGRFIILITVNVWGHDYDSIHRSQNEQYELLQSREIDGNVDCLIRVFQKKDTVYYFGIKHCIITNPNNTLRFVEQQLLNPECRFKELKRLFEQGEHSEA